MIPRYKDITELLKKGSTMEAQEKIMELREAVTVLQDENSELKSSLKSLKASINFERTLTFQAPFYFSENDVTPYCPRCWEVERIAVHLIEPFVSAAGPIYRCISCPAEIIHPRE